MSKYRSFKATERAVARLLGGQRLGHLGGADVVTNELAVECKHRRKLPDWLQDAMRQAAWHSGPQKLPVVVLHEAGARHNDNLVVMRLTDFRAWFVSRVDNDPADKAMQVALNGDMEAEIDNYVEGCAEWS